MIAHSLPINFIGPLGSYHLYYQIERRKKRGAKLFTAPINQLIKVAGVVSIDIRPVLAAAAVYSE